MRNIRTENNKCMAIAIIYRTNLHKHIFLLHLTKVVVTPNNNYQIYIDITFGIIYKFQKNA